MALYRYSADALTEVKKSSLAEEAIREREDLQRLLRAKIEIIDEDLLIVAEEYALWRGSQRRIDLLAVDRAGTLVVIELKRTNDGGHMELQALRYAAMISTMTPDQLVRTFAHYNHVDEDQARLELLRFIEVDSALEELPAQVRIILVSADFSTEITSTVLWLNANYATDIRCYRLVTYRLDDDVLIDVQQIIPLPEAADFQIMQGTKGAAAAAERAGREGPDGRDFTKYDVRLGAQSWLSQSKQSAIKLAVIGLWRAQVDFDQIREAILPSRWLPVTPREGETVEEAFVREYPGTSPTHRWYDLGIEHDGHHWVTPRFGGTRTEEHLDSLAAAGRGLADLSWSRTAASASETQRSEREG